MVDDGQHRYWWVPIVTTLIVAIAGIATALITTHSVGGGGPSGPHDTTPTSGAQTSQLPVGKTVTLDFNGGIAIDAQGNRIVTSITAPDRVGVVVGPDPAWS